MKVVTLTRGGLADGGKKSVVTTNCKKSAEAIVPRKKTWEGLNNHMNVYLEAVEVAEDEGGKP